MTINDIPQGRFISMDMNEQKIFGNKIVWITGASSGIGETLANTLAPLGCMLILSGRRIPELERVRSECGSVKHPITTSAVRPFLGKRN